MYFSVFPSSEYMSDEEINCQKNKDNEEICLICWMPSETNNDIKCLSDYSYIIKICDCKPKIHSSCLNNWIQKNPSCPICRKQITIQICYNNTNDNDNAIVGNVYIYFYVNCLKYTVNCFKLFCYIIFFNMFYLYVYNFYLFYNENQFEQNYLHRY